MLLHSLEKLTCIKLLLISQFASILSLCCIYCLCTLQIDDATLMYYRNSGGEKEFKYLELEADIDENMSDLCLIFDR